MNKLKKILKCIECKHIWNYNGTTTLTNCPSCGKIKEARDRSEFQQKNKERLNKQCNIWYHKNKDKWKLYHERRERRPIDRIKINARRWAFNHKQRRLKCLLCLLEGKEVLSESFHHTDYESHLGFSVCKDHHQIADKWIRTTNEVHPAPEKAILRTG